MRKYAIIDVETTGGLFNRDKITEVAIIVTDGKSILKEFKSLINPERSIPGNITRITGIDDDLVKDAPKFYEVAKEIIEITDKCIFVAHNARFDYSFIKEEFRNLGYAYNRKTLCSIKLTRAFVPGLQGYGLDRLIDHFGLSVENRHRAYDDTLATYQIFRKLFDGTIDDFAIDNIINQGINASVLPKGLSIGELHDAPESAGIYYLSNEHERIVYVGKAKNIKKRLFQHFRQLSRKSMNIYNSIHKLHYERSGNELIALLWELHEIKKLQPELNKALRRNNYPYALYKKRNRKEDEPGLTILKHNNKNDAKHEKVKLFGSKISADSYLQNLILDHDLCARQVKTRSKELLCNCRGECQSFFEFQQDVIEVIVDACKNEFDTDQVLLLKGRIPQERSFILIENGRFVGFGFISKEEAVHSSEEWSNYLQFRFSYPEANGIIKTYLRKHVVTKIDI